MIIRNETEKDFREVEELTRKAFWNTNAPGCDEHYLVNIMRTHKDFIPELDFVIELDGKIIANVMYTKATLTDDEGNEKNILTFGPISVLPEYQRKGYGRTILKYSFEKAISLKYDTVVIFGNPENYICYGFKSSKKYNICTENGVFPVAMLVKELKENAIPKKRWIYRESDVYNVDWDKAVEFDRNFEPMKKEYRKSQELFYIYSHSRII